MLRKGKSQLGSRQVGIVGSAVWWLSASGNSTICLHDPSDPFCQSQHHCHRHTKKHLWMDVARDISKKCVFKRWPLHERLKHSRIWCYFVHSCWFDDEIYEKIQFSMLSSWPRQCSIPPTIGSNSAAVTQSLLLDWHSTDNGWNFLITMENYL